MHTLLLYCSSPLQTMKKTQCLHNEHFSVCILQVYSILQNCDSSATTTSITKLLSLSYSLSLVGNSAFGMARTSDS